MNSRKITGVSIDNDDDNSAVNLYLLKELKWSLNDQINANRELISNSIYLKFFNWYTDFRNPQNLILSGNKITSTKIIGSEDGSITFNKNINQYFGTKGMDIKNALININLNPSKFTFVTVFEHFKDGFANILFQDSNNNIIYTILINNSGLSIIKDSKSANTPYPKRF